MNTEYLNKTGTGVNPDVIGTAISSLGQIGINIADAAKRRQMDYAMGQQRLQAELGLAETSAKAAADTARLNLLAQAATGKKATDEKKPNIATAVGVTLGFFVIVGTIVYFATKD
jgi:hypothetical protein